MKPIKLKLINRIKEIFWVNASTEVLRINWRFAKYLKGIVVSFIVNVSHLLLSLMCDLQIAWWTDNAWRCLLVIFVAFFFDRVWKPGFKCKCVYSCGWSLSPKLSLATPLLVIFKCYRLLSHLNVHYADFHQTRENHDPDIHSFSVVSFESLNIYTNGSDIVFLPKIYYIFWLWGNTYTSLI